MADSHSNGLERVEASFLLSPGDVHVWIFDAGVSGRAWDHLLSGDESEAARRLTGPSQVRFKSRRGALRLLLGRYLQADPASLEFCRDQNGKPSLVRGDINFNLSRGANICAIAVARNCEIGIDIERLREIDDRNCVASKFFESAEIEALTKANPSEVDRLFLNIWTRKEAVLKTAGLGVSHGLSIAVPTQERLQGFHIAPPGLEGDYYLYDLALISGIVGTLAARNPINSIAERWLPTQETEPSQT